MTEAAPLSSLPYRDTMIRESRLIWGLDAPVPAMAAQIGQESGWQTGVCSAYACGLTQFTPATAAWIGQAEPTLAHPDVFNPGWALRALVIYDFKLYNQVFATQECDRWAMTLSAYNGGIGWVKRDAAICRKTTGCDSARWFGNVERYSSRAALAFKENRAYPRRILHNQPAYADWGRSVTCPPL